MLKQFLFILLRLKAGSNFVKVKYLITCSLLILASSASGQKDKEFWFAAPEVDSANNPSAGLYDRPILLRMTTSGIAATVVVSMPADINFTSFTVDIAANSTYSLDLTEWINLIENAKPNVTQNKGLLIQSSSDITAYYEVQSLQCHCNPELFALKGRNAIGNEFFIPSQLTWAIDTVRHPNAKAAFDIVATQDNTSITITPSKPLIGRKAGVPFTITLNKGQTFSCQGLYHNASNLLNGSKVVSDKPIAVTTKEDLLFGDGPCADLAGDQLIPTAILGDEYAVVRGNLSVRDKVVITAISNGTNVFLDGNGVSVATINAGESYEADITSNPSLYIKTTKKVYVLHYSGSSCEVGSAVIPKLNCTGSDAVSIVRSDADGAYVLLITQNGNQGSFQVNGDGSIITAADFAPLDGTLGAYVYCKKEVSAYMPITMATTFSNSSGKFQLGFLNGSTFFGGCLYGYFSDYKRSNVATSQLDLCAKDSVQLNAIGGVSYVWSPALGLSNNKISNPNASPASTTKYKVIITDAFGCIDSAFVEVVVKNCEAAPVLSCNSWLKVTTKPDAVSIGDLDVTGNKLTVEAMFSRTTPYTPSNDYRYAGDIVSKHMDPSDCNYLLRPRHAEITTTNGFFATPAVCDLELNKTYHVAMVYDGSTLKFYRNGFLMSQVPASGNLITNNYLTKIGDVAGPWSPPPTNFTGYINEVRIWNVARTQAQLKAGMNVLLANPTSQLGLMAYYSFNSLANKQGNNLWNGKLLGNAATAQTNTNCVFVADSCEIVVPPQTNSCIKVLQANYGGTGEDIAYDVVDAGAGQFYMVGNTNSFGAGGTDILVVKMDGNKNIIWSNTYGVSGNETIRKASPSLDGGLLITGQTNSFANGAGDILCTKIKPDGSLQWVRTFGVGSANGDLGSDIIQTSDGGYAVSAILDVAGFVADGLVIKLDVNANQVWAKRFKTDVGEDGSSIVESGNKLIATFDIERQVGLDYAMAISELQTSNGQVLATKRILSTSKGIFRPIIYKDFGTGYWISGHLISESNYGQMEQVILHLNASYNITKTYKLVKNPLTNGFYTGFAPLKSGGFITCASEPLNWGAKGHIYKIAADGKVLFAKQISTAGKSGLNALTISGGKIIAVGSEDHAGNADFYLADFDSTGKNDDLCNIDTSIVSVQEHPFTVSNFSWTTVENQSFSDIVQTLTLSPQTLVSNALCTKDTCIIPAIVPDFIIPDTVCVNTPVTIANKSAGATTNYWSFCVADLNTLPTIENLGNIGGVLSSPVFMDYAFDNGNYYGFVANHAPGSLIRLDFGNSLLNTPTAISLGNFGGVIPEGYGTEGIQVVKNEGKWYAIIVGGNDATGYSSRILKVEFGASLSNPSPIATNWGNIGNIDQPIDLHVFREGSNWYGFTVNALNHSVTRFNFGTSFSNTPTGVNLGNLGNLDYPTGISAIIKKGKWYVYITNGWSNNIVRLDFGNSLLNVPTAVNLGNPNDALSEPRDIYMMQYCDDIVGFVVNNGFDDIVRLNFNDNPESTPLATPLGNIGNFSFPHSISKLFRIGDDLYSFITNVDNNTISRLKFTGCAGSNIPNSALKDPPPFSYTTPGTYNINLTIDDGLPTQGSVCKQVVVMPAPTLDFSYQQDICNPLQISFFGSDSTGKISWNFGDGSVQSNQLNPIHLFAKAGTFKVKFSMDGFCEATIEKSITVNIAFGDVIKNKDTVICENGSVQLRADSAAEYCWTPSTYLSNPSISNPVAKPLKDITYYLVEKTVGKNLVVNGNFSAGNSAFSSEYNYANNNTTEGEYFVGVNPQAWNGGLDNCADHTSGNGNMLLVNGSPTPDIKVWSQSIPVTPNTNFEFSTWIQALWSPNPAKLQFSINGIILGETITAALPTCTWSRFNTNWNSGNNSTAVISIVNKNTEIQGNDFALDDISFAPISYKRDSVKIIINRPLVKTNNDTSVCEGSPVPLKTTGGASYLWSPAAGLSDPAIGNPIATIKTITQYIVTGTNANGCTAKDTVVISILPKPTLNPLKDTAVCGAAAVQLNAFGAASYQWSPTTGLNNPSIFNPLASPLSTTKYFVKATGVNGCVANDSVTVQVMPPLVISVSNDTLICGNSKVQLKAAGATRYQWSPSLGLNNSNIANPIASPSVTTKYKVIASNGQCSATDSVTISILPSPTIILSNDTSICKEGSANLTATGGVSYSWSPSTGLSSISLPNTIANPASTTKYKVTVTGANTCVATDSVVVSILTPPNIILSKDTTICGVGSVPLLASGGVSYLWNPSIGLDNNLIANPIASPTITTTYQVKAKGTNACTAAGSVLVKVLPALATRISNDTAVCTQKSAQLLASGGVKYQWVPASGLSNPLIANPIANPSTTTAYSVKITGADNCTATEFVTVTILSLPIIGLTSDTAICRSTGIELKATGGNSYQWTPATGLSSTSIANPISSPIVATTYTVLVTGANNCVSSASVTVSIRPTAQFGVINDSLVGCENQPVQLQAFGGEKYTWSPTTGLSNATIANPVAKLQTSQTYTVVISESVCKEQASFIIPVSIRSLPPLVVIKSNDITCNTPYAQLNTSNVGVSYAWTPAIGLSSSIIANPLANPSNATIYTVNVEDANGCISKGAVAVKVYNNNDFRLYQMPNAFTPDRNGNNDCFGVSKWGAVRIVYFEIYNRWGQMVFTGSNTRQCWDGTLNDQPQPSGNFVYRIKVETMCGVVEKKGSVMLIR